MPTLPTVLSPDHLPEYVNQFTISSEPAYMLTVVPGLETVAADEAARKVGASIAALSRGKVFFTVPEPFTLASLRCADNIYTFLYAGETGPTRDALHKYSDLLATSAFKGAVEKLRQGFNRPRLSFTVNAGIAGKHNYSRFEAAEAFAQALERLYGFTPTAPDETTRAADVEFRLDIADGRLLVFSKLTDAAFRFRGVNRGFSKAALRPTVAHALVWAAGPFDDETVLDLFCGSGTILCERAAYPCRKLIGNDIDAQAVAQARGNLTPTEATLVTGDIRQLRLTSGSVDTVITNPPWGGQIKTEDPLALYKAFLRKSGQLLTKNGKILALTPLSAVLEQAAEAENFETRVLYRISLHGTLSYVYRLERRIQDGTFNESGSPAGGFGGCNG